MEYLILHDGAEIERMQSPSLEMAQRHADITHSWPVVAVSGEATSAEFVEALLMSKLKLLPAQVRIDTLAACAAAAAFKMGDHVGMAGGPKEWQTRAGVEIADAIMRALNCSNSLMAAGLREIAAGAHPVGGTAMQEVDFHPKRIALRTLTAAGVK